MIKIYQLNWNGFHVSSFSLSSWISLSSISGNLSAILFENQNMTTLVAMEMKYLHGQGISNYAEIPLILTNHLLGISYPEF